MLMVLYFGNARGLDSLAGRNLELYEDIRE